jgi:uncharacterized protein YbjT (DUF2867 family)
MTQKHLIIGATGRVGSRLVELLLEQDGQVRAATRSPSHASTRFPSSVETVEFDYNRPETFASAVEGVSKVFLVVRPGDNHSDQAAMPLIDVAKQAGVRLFVNLTAMGVERDETFMLRVLEKYVESSGIPYVHLRPNWFMQNFDSGPMYADIRSTGALHLPAADAKLSFIDARDIASVAAAVMSDPRHEGKAYTLTGGESLDHYEIVDVLSRVSGKAISYVSLSEEAAQGALKSAGVAADLIDRWTNFYRIVRAGLCASVSPAVEEILGRPAIRFEQYARDNAGVWSGNL